MYKKRSAPIFSHGGFVDLVVELASLAKPIGVNTLWTLFYNLLDVIGDFRPEHRFASQKYALDFSLMCCVNGFKNFVSQIGGNQNSIGFEYEAVFENEIAVDFPIPLDFEWNILFRLHAIRGRLFLSRDSVGNPLQILL